MATLLISLAVWLAWAFIFGSLVVMALAALTPSWAEGYEQRAGQRLWELMLADERLMRGVATDETGETGRERGTAA